MDEYMPNYTAALAEDKNLEATSYTDSGRRLAIYPINTGYTQFGGQVRGDIVDKLKLAEGDEVRVSGIPASDPL